MGVYGLWRLLDPTGKPVPLETLEGKVLAVDVSIWIYQVLQGYQDQHGNPKPNAHLFGLFSRICKLLYYKIKPVFVFDGGVPMLKKNTIASRRKQKSIATSKAQKMKTDLMNNLIKRVAVKSALSTERTETKNHIDEVSSNLSSKPPVQDMFQLPNMSNTVTPMKYESSDDSDFDADSYINSRKQNKWVGNIHNVDVSSVEFKALPADVRYDILNDLKETRKQSSWGRLYEMPEELHDFSSFQMKRLLKRRLVQECLESAEKEMGGKTLTLEELDKLLTEQGITNKGSDAAHRIAADSTARLIYVDDKNLLKDNPDVERTESKNTSGIVTEIESVTGEIESVAGPSKDIPILEDMNEYELNDEWDSDVELTISSHTNSASVMETTTEVEVDSDTQSNTKINQLQPSSKKYFGKHVMNPALTYMLEYSGLTEEQIVTLLKQNRGDRGKITDKCTKSPQRDRSNTTDNQVNNKNVRADKNQVSIQSRINTDIPEKPPEETNTVCKQNESTFQREQLESVSQNQGNALETSATQSNSTDNTSNEIFNLNDDENYLTINERHPSVDNVRESTTESTSDSDSHDFIEIKDAPVQGASTVKENTSQKNLEITIKSCQNITDDMFADIFENACSNPDLTTTFEEVTRFEELPAETLHELYHEPLKTKKDSVSANNMVLPSASEREAIQNYFDSLNTNLKSDTAQINDKDLESNDAETSKANSSIDELKQTSSLPVNEDELMSLKEQLEHEQEGLMASIGKLERQAMDISDQIRVEAQELLRLFGIPYIIAPMEAEAQCAYLEQVHLTDGTITDDSDIWLFGGQCVYKNFFNNNKRVLQFRSSDIRHHFKLTRNEMIQLALLVGSDYTAGVPGIGPVTALEILAAFPAEGDNLLNGLTNFYSWMQSGRLPGPGKTGLRSKLRNVQVEKGFPSQAVTQAYLFPAIDESKEGFTWGKPNITLLSNYTKSKFGWTTTKFDEVMKPVLKRLEEHKNQKAIDSYFKVCSVPKSIEANLSKRVQNAVRRLQNENPEAFEEATDAEPKKKKNKTKTTKETKDMDESSNDTINPKTKQNVVETKCESPPCSNHGEAKKSTQEYIPQREKTKAEALKKKLHAIEVLRKSKKGLNKTRRVKRQVRKIKKEAELSESDSSSS